MPYDLEWTDFNIYQGEKENAKARGRMLLEIVVTPLSRPIGFINLGIKEKADYIKGFENYLNALTWYQVVRGRILYNDSKK